MVRTHTHAGRDLPFPFISDDVTSIPVSEVDLPCHGGGNETDYNDSIRKHGDVLVLDRAFVRIPGETTFEACDLVSRSGALVHVKRKGKPSTFSHPFAQAGNSCDLLAHVPYAREQFRRLVTATSRDNVPRDMPSALDRLEDRLSDSRSSSTSSVTGETARSPPSRSSHG